jgi:Flp pilus assembly protein CpaB
VRLLRLRRFPILFWIVALALAAGTASVVAGSLAAAESRARQWGAVADVPVAAHDVGAGVVLTSRDVVHRRLPAALLPRSGIAADPVGHAVVVPVVAGEVLLEAKVAPWGVRGIAAAMPPGTRALAVPRGDASPPLHAGDRVDVLATFALGDGAQGREPTFPVAVRALVLDVADNAITVAVTEHEAPRVAFALAQGTIALALTA